MRGYYGIFDDTIYEIDADCFRKVATSIVNSKPTRLTTNRWKNTQIDVDIYLSNLIASALSNAELYEDVVTKLKTDKTTKLTKLVNNYKMIVEYQLVDNDNNVISDEGCLIQQIAMSPAVFPLGLTSDNQYVLRSVLDSGMVKFSRGYRQQYPAGVTRTSMNPYGRKFTLYVLRISIIQYKGEAMTIEPVVDPAGGHDIEPGNRGFHHRPEPMRARFPKHGRPFEPGNAIVPPELAHGGNHPSMGSVTYASARPTTKNSIVIYDTENLGIQFDPIELDVAPSEISFHIEVALNDYLVTADRDDIEYILKENAEPAPVEPGIQDGDTPVDDEIGDDEPGSNIEDPGEEINDDEENGNGNTDGENNAQGEGNGSQSSDTDENSSDNDPSGDQGSSGNTDSGTGTDNDQSNPSQPGSVDDDLDEDDINDDF